VEVSSEDSRPPATSVPETALEWPKVHAERYIIGLILLTIAMTIFILLGGLRWLRRFAPGHTNRYHKLDSEDSR
jgi:hypothetical protein